MSEPRPEYTVSSLTDALKRAVEGGFSRIVVEGEVSNWRRYPSGHCYFTLKDLGAQISAVMFSGPYESSLRRHPELAPGMKDGAKVKVYGTVTVYPPRGNYQINVQSAVLAGMGELMQRYLDLKAKLEAEGLFDSARKRPLPFMPRRIGIVTSPSGAVVHDICRVLMRRFPALEARLFPATVQGDLAPKSVKAGLGYFAECRDWRADVVIVARGGGSFEDLFPFNDESLVRALAASPVPTISAVGHETDFTLCDFAADVRAGTPSMAAELAVPVFADLSRKLDAASSSLVSSLRGKYEWFAQRMDAVSDSLSTSLMRREADARRRLEVVAAGLSPALVRYEAEARRRVEVVGAKLALLSPFSVLDRGYSLTTDSSGRVVCSPLDVKAGDVISTRLRSGSISSRVVS